MYPNTKYAITSCAKLMTNIFFNSRYEQKVSNVKRINLRNGGSIPLPPDCYRSAGAQYKHKNNKELFIVFKGPSPVRAGAGTV